MCVCVCVCVCVCWLLEPWVSSKCLVDPVYPACFNVIVFDEAVNDHTSSFYAQYQYLFYNFTSA